MIDEEATKEAFGYYASELKLKSHKPIICICDECGKVRITSKDNYFLLCHSCGIKGEKNPNYSKFSQSHPRFGKHHTKETKAIQSAANSGEKHYNYKGGKKLAEVRHEAKRKRQLGYTLLVPLAEGEVGHHVTNEYVIGIPSKIHQQFGGHTRKLHRQLMVEWLKANDIKKYEIVLKVL